MHPATSVRLAPGAPLNALQDFLAGVNDGARLHAKKQKNNSVLLYVSREKKNGIKERLFPAKFQRRKANARSVISQITNNQLTRRALSGGDYNAHVVAGTVKSMLAEKLRSEEVMQALTCFEAIDLHLEDGKVCSSFSAYGAWSDALAPMTDRISWLGGSNRKPASKIIESFIHDQGLQCPFATPYVFNEILDAGLDLHQIPSKVNNIIAEVFSGQLHGDKLAEEFTKLSRHMANSLETIKFCAALFGNEELISRFPWAQREKLRQIGDAFTGLYNLLTPPKGPVLALSQLAGLAINSPADFKSYLDEYRSKFVKANLPAGAILDEAGNLSGSQIMKQVPDFTRYPEMLIQAREYAGKSIEGMLEAAKTESLAREQSNIGGIIVHTQASKDFWRFDYEIPTENDTVFRSSDLPVGDDQQKSRNLSVAHAVHRFTNDNANATLVLSSVLNQTTIGPLFHCLEDSWGGGVPFRLLNRFNAAGTLVQIQKEDGTAEQISPHGMGGSKWVLSHATSEDGKPCYKVSVDWQTYAVANDGQDWLRLAENTAIGIHFRADLYVDAGAAQQGILNLSIPGGVVATFSGGLNAGGGQPGAAQNQQAQQH